MKDDAAGTSQGNILVVDDLLETLNLLTALLEERGHRVRRAIDGPMALMGASAHPPDLILLDINMPGMGGYEVCQRLKADEVTREIPVIFVSALNEVFDKVKAFEVGGVDYITKPFQIEEVLARIESQLALKLARQQIQELNAELEGRVWRRTRQLEEANRELKTLNQRLEREIVHHQQTQSQLLHMASHDALTGLPNRVFFMDKLMGAIARTKEQPDYRFAVLFMDCDRFKVVNDSLGHMAGDRLLISLARRLQFHLKAKRWNRIMKHYPAGIPTSPKSPEKPISLESSPTMSRTSKSSPERPSPSFRLGRIANKQFCGNIAGGLVIP